MHGESSKFNYRLAEVFYNLKDYPACIYYANKAFLSDNTAHYKKYANNIMASSMSKLKMTKSSDDYLNLLTSIATWDKMPIKVWFQPTNLNINLESALQAWQKYLAPTVSFKVVYNKNDADITVSFADENQVRKFCNKVEEREIIGGCTRVSTQLNTINKAEILLNMLDKENTKFTNVTIYSVLVHEIGHAIGIVGHSENKYDIMSAKTSQYNYFSYPTKRDLTTVLKLYSR